MTLADGLLDGETIRRLVEEVAHELDSDGVTQHVVIVVGGSLLAWHGLRDATRDVDSIGRIDPELRVAINAVAKRHRLAVDWLNDSATPFGPATLDVAQCDVLIESRRLLVLGAPLRDVFLMKLSRSDVADLADMRSMWPHISDGFVTAGEVVDAFYAAFPHEPADEHLASFVVMELAKGGFSLPLG